VEAGAVVNSSIVWESRGARSLFGGGGISGLANVDITPELAARVAMAFGSTLKKGTTVVTSRDSSRSARMLKRAMMAGLNATGVNVEDLEVATVPVTRFVVRRPANAAGLTIRLDPDDSQSVTIRFFDDDGHDLTEDAQRKIERLVNREDFRRVFAGEIGDIGFASRALEHYATALEKTVDTERIRARKFKVVVDYAYGATSFVMPNVLAKLGLDALVVNPFVSTAGLLSMDLDEHARNVSKLVTASGSDVGAVIDPSGDRVVLIDDQGHVLDHTQVLLGLLELLEQKLHGNAVALPIATTDRAVERAEAHGYEVIFTQMSDAALMDASSLPGTGFAGNQEGGFVLPGFLPAFDGAATLVKVLDLLAHHERSLSDVIAGQPKVFRLHEMIVTPWDQKGMLMRTLVEQSKDRQVDLIDGVKIHHDQGWVLAYPDPEAPITHLWSEGRTDADARQLLQEYARRIRQLVR